MKKKSWKKIGYWWNYRDKRVDCSYQSIPMVGFSTTQRWREKNFFMWSYYLNFSSIFVCLTLPNSMRVCWGGVSSDCFSCFFHRYWCLAWMSIKISVPTRDLNPGGRGSDLSCWLEIFVWLQRWGFCITKSERVFVRWRNIICLCYFWAQK